MEEEDYFFVEEQVLVIHVEAVFAGVEVAVVALMVQALVL